MKLLYLYNDTFFNSKMKFNINPFNTKYRSYLTFFHTLQCLIVQTVCSNPILKETRVTELKRSPQLLPLCMLGESLVKRKHLVYPGDR